MMKFEIKYKNGGMDRYDPDNEEKTCLVEFEGTEEWTAMELAEDYAYGLANNYAYALANKGRYEIKEVSDE